MTERNKQIQILLESYQEEAEATGWFGPEVVFGLSYAYVKSRFRSL